MVPQKVLDTELKKSFAHFNEGRIPVSVCGASWGLLGGLGFTVQVEALFSPGHVCYVVLQRWCWRHPWGSDLLRMASFQNNIYHEKDDIRWAWPRESALFVVDFSGRKLGLLPNVSASALTSAPTAAQSK